MCSVFTGLDGLVFVSGHESMNLKFFGRSIALLTWKTRLTRDSNMVGADFTCILTCSLDTENPRQDPFNNPLYIIRC